MKLMQVEREPVHRVGQGGHEKAVYRKKPPCRWVRTGKKRGHRGFRRDCGGRGVWVQIKDRDTEEADREHHQSLTRAFGFE